MLKRILLVAALALVPSFSKAEEPKLPKELKSLEWMIGEWQVDQVRLNDSSLNLGLTILEFSPIEVRISGAKITASYSYFIAPDMLPLRHLGVQVAASATVTSTNINDPVTLNLSEEFTKEEYQKKLAELVTTVNSKTKMESRGKDEWVGRRPNEHVLIKRIGEWNMEVIVDALENLPYPAENDSLPRDHGRLELKCHKVKTGTAKTAEFRP